MDEVILTLNAGSSSIKFGIFGAAALRHVAAGVIENIGIAPHCVIRDAAGVTVFEKSWPHAEGLTHEDLLGTLLGWVDHHLDGATLIAAGHRIVHGGDAFTRAVLLDDATLVELAKLNRLAPLHEPHNLAAVEAVRALAPGLPQIGCFDTSFHHTMPAVSTRFALPRRFHDDGVRRYGFHGLSYEYVAAALAAQAPVLAAGRVIAAHLGNGASACAMLGGKSMDSSMGFTAVEGLVMGTRCGAIDPGVIIYMMQAYGMSADEITDLVYKKSGLLGVSGLSADMRVLLASDAPAAAQAIDTFTFAAARQMAALVVSLGGVDGIVFTAGIGDRAPAVRAQICARLAWLGVELDPAANAANATVISRTGARVEVRVIPTDEDTMVARHVQRLVCASGDHPEA